MKVQKEFCPECGAEQKHGMKDITGARYVTVEIREDGKTLWVNTEDGCELRISDIEKIKICDKRKER